MMISCAGEARGVFNCHRVLNTKAVSMVILFFFFQVVILFFGADWVYLFFFVY